MSRDYRLDRPRVRWPTTVKVAVGKEVFSIMYQNVTFDMDQQKHVVVQGKWMDATGELQEPVGKVTRNIPAFCKIFKSRKTQEVEEIKPYPSLWSLYDQIKKVELDFRPGDLPMVCPPLPWLSHTTGAYLALTTDLIKPIGITQVWASAPSSNSLAGPRSQTRRPVSPRSHPVSWTQSSTRSTSSALCPGGSTSLSSTWPSPSSGATTTP